MWWKLVLAVVVFVVVGLTMIYIYIPEAMPFWVVFLIGTPIVTTVRHVYNKHRAETRSRYL